MKSIHLLASGLVFYLVTIGLVHAMVLTTLPGPDDQGGMIMPMVYFDGQKFSVSGLTDTNGNVIGSTIAQLAPLTYWSPGNTLSTTSPWYGLLDPVGGQGLAFGNRYGYMMDPSSEFLPTGNSIGIRLVSSTSGISFYNYRSGLSGTALFDQVFLFNPAQGHDYVLWNGSMWHFYAAVDSPGTYSATFEIFMANTTFHSGTGFVDYSTVALEDTNYESALLNLTWVVVPEPGTLVLASVGLALLGLVRGGPALARRNSAFTLIEMLVVISILMVLAALAQSGVSGALNHARNLECASKMRQLSMAILLYAEDNDHDFPRTSHSSYSYQQRGWGRSILPYFSNLDSSASTASWNALFQEYYRCPVDKRSSVTLWSYGMNVFFELNPDGDDYQGSPCTWRKVIQVERQTRTILLAESKNSSSGVDHFMAHFWTTSNAAANAVDSLRHVRTANYAFVDGHVESLRVEETFNPATGVNLWNPSLAR